MSYNRQHIIGLIGKHIRGERLSQKEKSDLDHWLQLAPANRESFEQVQDEAELKRYLAMLADQQDTDQAFSNFQRQHESPQPSIRRIHYLHRWGWVAASVLLLIATAIFLVVFSDRPASSGMAITQSTDIQPGKEGAILTLSDGSQLVLDSLGNGVVASQNGMQVVLKDGQLAYAPHGETSGAIAYNTMTIPKGRQFRVILPDGTKVWLNAASSIRYPTAFKGKERRVEITGEAYFEVMKNTKMPFRVNINGRAKIEVLGTHFNVNAYENERSINTTLIEGAIAVAVHTHRPVILKPGQQAQIVNPTGGRPENAATNGLAGQKTQPGTIAVVNDAGIDKVMAWKNGLFNFEEATLEEIMRQLERWYDIEVVYEKNVPDIELMGKITRDVSLNGLLTALQKMGVNYRLKGRKLMVLP